MNATLCNPRPFAMIAMAIACVLVIAGSTDVRAATPAFVTRVTAAQTVTNVQISVVASAPVEYQFVNVRPNWIVLQIAPAELQIHAGTLPFARGVVKKIRVGQFTPQAVRLVVEMASPTPFRVIPLHDELALLVGVPGETGILPDAGRTLPDVAAVRGGHGGPAPSAAGTTPSRVPQASVQRVHAVLPGEGIGPVRLGMRIQEALAVLGPAKSTQVLPDGNMLYAWFVPPMNRGIGLRATPSGVVYRVWVLNDDQYAIADRIRIGNTETEARAALGAPSQVVADTSSGTKTLAYSSLGLWVGIQTDPRYTFYGRIFEFGVTKPEALAPEH
ncbi:MAG TPA: AMIN domain-containing protein [bacterium]|nr:AMIN domain-containing protein [bacterium]